MKLPHATYYGADKVNIEDGVDIDQMEEDGKQKKGITAKSSHVEENERLRRANSLRGKIKEK
jgi:hypothetical protein